MLDTLDLNSLFCCRRALKKSSTSDCGMMGKSCHTFVQAELFMESDIQFKHGYYYYCDKIIWFNIQLGTFSPEFASASHTLDRATEVVVGLATTTELPQRKTIWKLRQLRTTVRCSQKLQKSSLSKEYFVKQQLICFRFVFTTNQWNKIKKIIKSTASTHGIFHVLL